MIIINPFNRMYVFTLYLSNCVQKPYHLRIRIFAIEMENENPVFSRFFKY